MDLKQPYQCNIYMEMALEQAKKAFSCHQVPVGAVVVDNKGKVIAHAHNSNMVYDPTAHAEIKALRQACLFLQSNRLDGCSLYVTLEPCAMCAMAISYARIENLYYGAKDIKAGAVDSGICLYEEKICHHKPRVYSGIYENQAAQLLKDFFQIKRLKQKNVI